MDKTMPDVEYCKKCVAYAINDDGIEVCGYDSVPLESLEKCHENENVIVFDCYACEARHVDEYGDEYCGVDGNLISDLDECPEDAEWCEYCEEHVDYCYCGVEPHGEDC